jgi:hypothetical protein
MPIISISMLKNNPPALSQCQCREVSIEIQPHTIYSERNVFHAASGWAAMPASLGEWHRRNHDMPQIDDLFLNRGKTVNREVSAPAG